MTRHVIFVHGTGVRQQSYQASIELIRRQLDKHLGAKADACFWGGTTGARLLAQGASIPDYADTGGGEPDEAEQELARWAILYADPWYELRLLGDARFDASEMGFGGLSPRDALDKQLRDYQPGDEFAKLMREAHLSKYWLVAHKALLESAEFDRAVASVGDDPGEHRRVLAHALVAKLIGLSRADFVPMIDGAARDALVQQLGTDFKAFGRGVPGWLTKPFAGLAKRWATRKLKRERGAISDAAIAMPADIILYQTRGQPIRDYIADAVALSAGDEVVLFAHSLGGIAAVDLLIGTPLAKVKALVTVGSQAPLMYELNCLSSLEYGNVLPDHFPRWLNIYDPSDTLSYVGAALFPNRVVDVRVDNGQPFPESHSAYFANPEVWKAVAGFLGG